MVSKNILNDFIEYCDNVKISNESFFDVINKDNEIAEEGLMSKIKENNEKKQEYIDSIIKRAGVDPKFCDKLDDLTDYNKFNEAIKFASQCKEKLQKALERTNPNDKSAVKVLKKAIRSCNWYIDSCNKANESYTFFDIINESV